MTVEVAPLPKNVCITTTLTSDNLCLVLWGTLGSLAEKNISVLFQYGSEGVPCLVQRPDNSKFLNQVPLGTVKKLCLNSGDKNSFNLDLGTVKCLPARTG